MEFKEFSKLTKEEASEILKQWEHLKDNCLGLDCTVCVADPSNYGIKNMACRDFIEEYVKPKAAGNQTFEFTPETTSLEYMLAHNTLRDVADYLQEKSSEICSTHGCGNCPIHQRNFAPEWEPNKSSCDDVRSKIKAAAFIIERFKTIPAAKETGVCKNCGYKDNIGGFVYCRAWGNYTTESMYCGYYKPLDK